MQTSLHNWKDANIGYSICVTKNIPGTDWQTKIESHGTYISIDIACELFQIYRSIHRMGWDELENVVKLIKWTAMGEILRKQSGSLPKADSGSINDVVTMDVLESLQERMNDDDG